MLASGAISFFVAVWAVIYSGYSPITVAFLLIWLLIPPLLLYRFYDFKLGRRARRSAFLVLILGAGILNLSSLVFAVYAGVNFPKTRDFEERLILPAVPESEEEAWYQLRDLINNETPDREAVLGLLAANVVSHPRTESPHGKKRFRIFLFSGTYEDELAQITDLIAQGRDSEAEARYTRLWKAADNSLTGSGSLASHAVFRTIITKLVDF